MFPSGRVIMNNNIMEFILSDPTVVLNYEMNQLDKISYNMLDVIRSPKAQINKEQVDALSEQSKSVKTSETDLSKSQNSTKIILRPPFKTKRTESDVVFTEEIMTEVALPSFTIPKEQLEQDIYIPVIGPVAPEKPVVEEEPFLSASRAEALSPRASKGLVVKATAKLKSLLKSKLKSKQEAETKGKQDADIKLIPEIETKGKLEGDGKAKGKMKGKAFTRGKLVEKEKVKKAVEKYKTKETKEETAEAHTLKKANRFLQLNTREVIM